MQIAILLFDGLTALDAIGPYDVLSRLPDVTVTFVAEEQGLKRTDNRRLGLMADVPLGDPAAVDVVVVPGGNGTAALMDDGPLHEWLRAVNRSATWTTSVCTGSLLLAAAGLLNGRRATSHWLALDQLAGLGAEAVSERVVFDGAIVTAAGVSAGIDMALALAARIAGESVAKAIQLGIEYDPKPPFDAGSPLTAPPETVELLRSRSRFRPLLGPSVNG